jgi:hypothetical protein
MALLVEAYRMKSVVIDDIICIDTLNRLEFVFVLANAANRNA